jgi:hypothetical protein
MKLRRSSSRVSCWTGAKTAAAVIGVAVLVVGASACGSDSKQSAPTKQSTDSASPAVKKEAGLFSKATRLEVVNKTGQDLEVTICGNGNCKPARVLDLNESEDMAADNVTGWVCYNAAGAGCADPGEPADPFSPGPKQAFQIDFTASNPDVGLPKIELTTSEQLCELSNISYRPRFAGDWDSAPLKLEEYAQQQSTRSSLCQYKLVGSRAADTDYKMLTLTAYPHGADFPNVPYAG